MARIVLDGVAKVYPDGTEAVRDFTLDIEDGEFMVFVGPSGCGKTTALRMIAGLEDISRGTVTIGDRVVNDVPSKDRDVAMVFQNYALYPHLTVYDNMAFGLRLRKTDRTTVDDRVRKAGDVLGLSEFLERKPRNLSGGQRQRVAMGRAIVREPQVFLMDEPLSNLDAKLRVQMRAEIARIQADLGTTTIYVTHDQTEAMTMGDRVAVMKKGELQQVAPPQELYDHPSNLFVAGFIGSPAMNLVEAELARSDDGGMTVSFGTTRLALDPSLVRSRPALAAYDGRNVVLGIRPESLEDASLAAETTPDRRITARVDLRESLGSEVLVHFNVDAPPVLTEDTRELSRDLESGGVVVHEQERSRFVARLDPRTQAREREDIELAVDTTRLHLFDPETGQGIHDEAPARVAVPAKGGTA